MVADKIVGLLETNSTLLSARMANKMKKKIVIELNTKLLLYKN